LYTVCPWQLAFVDGSKLLKVLVSCCWKNKALLITCTPFILAISIGYRWCSLLGKWFNRSHIYLCLERCGRLNNQSYCDALFAILIGAKLRHLNFFGHANPILVSWLARAQPSLAIQQANWRPVDYRFAFLIAVWSGKQNIFEVNPIWTMNNN
jgi:hypothetical protein